MLKSHNFLCIERLRKERYAVPFYQNNKIANDHFIRFI